MLNENVSQYLQDNRERHLEKLFELLRIASIANLDDDACERAAQWICHYLRDIGLTADVIPTEGKPNVLAALEVSDPAPTLLIYGHYDVQPPEPLELWETPPFAPTIRDGRIHARGAHDDKGQFFAHLMAVEAWQRAGGGAPVNLKIFIEGEEEIGSPNLEPFVAAHKGTLAADAAVISDSAFFAEGVPSLTYALRGLVYVEVTVTGPNRDVHSGSYGGAVANPANALGRIISQMHDERGGITIPGFYDDVIPTSDEEVRRWNELPFDQERYAAELGLTHLAGGEKDLPVLVRLWGRPTLDCNGIVGGHTAEGLKTIIPSKASAKISMRLVPNQDPDKIVAGFEKFLTEYTPRGVSSEVAVRAQARPVLLKTDSPAMTAAKQAYCEGFGREPALIRCGASVPVTELIQRILGLDAVMMGFGLPDDRLHSPNERFPLDQFYRGAATSGAFMENLALTASD
jgi:acetylornithine deacetylase/succinyl-diaminopimelate desuccinylase-like protein